MLSLESLVDEGNTMFSLEDFLYANLDHLCLELSLEDQADAQKYQHYYSNDVACWNGYVNALCLNTLVKWLQTEPDLPTAILVSPGRSTLPSIWEVVNGSAIELNNVRFVLIPSESSDLETLCVPQEWIDIPSWAGHYYLAVQLHLEDECCWMRVWGFTTYRQVKQGQYDAIERTYSLERSELIENINMLWVAQETCLEVLPVIEPLPRLSQREAKKLLDEVGQPAGISPRLNLPFTQWGALLENETWRHHLYHQRLVPALNQWFSLEDRHLMQAIRMAGWQLYEEVFSTVEEQFLVRRFTTDEKEFSISWVKKLDWDFLPDYCPIALVINLMQKLGHIWIRPQVRPIGAINSKLPEGIKLVILDDLGESVVEKQAGKADNFIQTKPFSGDLGDKFTIKIELGQVKSLHNFVL